MKYLKYFEKYDEFKTGDLVKFVKISNLPHFKNLNSNEIYRIRKVNRGSDKYPPTFTIESLDKKTINSAMYHNIRHLTELEKNMIKFNL